MHEGIDVVRIKQDLLDTADFAFGRLRDRLDGLTDEEYFWEPADGCWSVRSAGDGTFRADGSPLPPTPAPLTTIAWRLCHIIDLLASERNATWIGVEPAGRLRAPRTGRADPSRRGGRDATGPVPRNPASRAVLRACLTADPSA